MSVVFTVVACAGEPNASAVSPMAAAVGKRRLFMG